MFGLYGACLDYYFFFIFFKNENKSHKYESIIRLDNSFIQENLLSNRRTCKMTGEI